MFQWVKDTSYFRGEKMIIEKVITNMNRLDEKKIEQLTHEIVYLKSADLLKRIQRVTTDQGRDLGIRLKNDETLAVGDILYMDDEYLITVDVLPDDLLVIQPQNMNEMGMIAHQLGNRHLPAQFENDEILIQYDYLVEQLLQQLEITYVREERKVKEPFQHIGHHHHD